MNNENKIMKFGTNCDQVKLMIEVIGELGYTPHYELVKCLDGEYRNQLVLKHPRFAPVMRSIVGKWDKSIGGKQLKYAIATICIVVAKNGTESRMFEKTGIDGKMWDFNTLMNSYAMYFEVKQQD